MFNRVTFTFSADQHDHTVVSSRDAWLWLDTRELRSAAMRPTLGLLTRMTTSGACTLIHSQARINKLEGQEPVWWSWTFGRRQ
jgi:hypothetical protein